MAEMIEQEKVSILTQRLLVKQLKDMEKLQKVLQEKLIQAEDKAHKIAEELQRTNSMLQDGKDVLLLEKEKLVTENNHFAEMTEDLQQTKSNL